MASQADLFHYDAVTVENQMAQLNQLEGYVMENPGITLGEMTTNGNTLASLVSDPNGISGFNLTNEKTFGIPGFFWGRVLGPFGVAVVYFVGKDKAETKMAIIGCVTVSVLSIGLSVISTILQARL
jgi:hypothetical protein